MNMQRFVDKVYEAAKSSGADEFQIEYMYSEHQTISLFDGKIEKQSDNEGQSLTLSVKKDGKVGSCSCGHLAEEVIPEIVAAAMENAVLITVGEENYFHDGSGRYVDVTPYCPLEDKLAALDTAVFLRDVEKAAYAADRRVSQVQKVYFGRGSSCHVIRNSLGLNKCEKGRFANAYISVTVKDGDNVQSCSYDVNFDKPEDFDAAFIARKAVDKAVSYLNGKNPASGIAKTIFENKTFAMLLGFLEDIVSAKEVQDKKSQFVGKIGQVVAAPIVNIWDNPHLNGGFATVSFDGEGYPTVAKAVIEKGVLQTYLHSLKTAHKDGVLPTGNGSGHNGNVTAMNFYLQAGEFSPTQLLKEVDTGIYINHLSGLHAGYNIVSGDFSFGAKGFEIKNGKIGSPFKQFTVAGNYYQMLKDIKMIADDLEFRTSGVGSPTVWVNGLTIGGK